MAEFRPRIEVAADATKPRRPWLWLALPPLALAAIGLLLFTGDDAPGTADPATIRATRADSGAARATRTPLSDLPPPDPYRPDPAGKALLQELELAPAAAKSGGTGYVVTKADAELLAHTPLREGDVLLELDGQKLDPARLERLADELGDYDDVWVSFERDGKKQEMLLELRRR